MSRSRDSGPPPAPSLRTPPRGTAHPAAASSSPIRELRDHGPLTTGPREAETRGQRSEVRKRWAYLTPERRGRSAHGIKRDTAAGFSAVGRRAGHAGGEAERGHCYGEALQGRRAGKVPSQFGNEGHPQNCSPVLLAVLRTIFRSHFGQNFVLSRRMAATSESKLAPVSSSIWAR